MRKYELRWDLGRSKIAALDPKAYTPVASRVLQNRSFRCKSVDYGGILAVHLTLTKRTIVLWNLKAEGILRQST